MTNPRNLVAGLAIIASAALAGCQTGPGVGQTLPRPGPASPPTSGIEGNWIDQAGTGITVFRAGTFQTIASDSGQRLSEGTYRIRDGRLVEIQGTSIIRQTSVSFNCSRATPVQLNCTAGTGQQFVLTRYGGAVPTPPSPSTAGALTPPPAPRV